MSWQGERMSHFHICGITRSTRAYGFICCDSAYVDTNLVGTGRVAKAAILGQQGGVWATSQGFEVGDFFLLNVLTHLLRPPYSLHNKNRRRSSNHSVT